MNLEIEILNFIQENIRNPLLDHIFIFITELGNIGYIYYLLTAILLISEPPPLIEVMASRNP